MAEKNRGNWGYNPTYRGDKVITTFIPGRGLPCGGQENARFGLSFLIEKLFH